MDRPLARYSRIAVILHWTVATIIVFELCVGMVMERIPDRHLRIPIVEFHSSMGIVVLLLGLFRLAWRLGHRPPPFDPGMTAWERHLAHGVDVLLYLLMIAMPVIGWSILSTSARALKSGTFLFGALRWPPISFLAKTAPARLDVAHDRFVAHHTLGGFIMIGLLCLHVAGAIKHQWIDGHRSLQRMWFARPSGSAGR